MSKDSLHNYCKENNLEHILNEWDFVKNNKLTPMNITKGSGLKVWWKCEHGHEWDAIIGARVKGTGCPYCLNKRILKGYNDLATLRPDILEEWDYEKNTIKPTEIPSKTAKKVWWKCKHGHSWETSVAHRTDDKNPTNCPVCCGQVVLRGFNDLITTHPHLKKEWHPIKNGKLKPIEVSKACNKRVWWKCKHNHEWQTSINHRTEANPTGCPTCSKSKSVSFPEKAVYFYVRKIHNEAIENYKPKWLNGMEVDIFIPNMNLGIEYDGQAFHNGQDSKKRDERKNKLFQKNNCNLIRLRETKSVELEENPNVITIESKANNYKALETNIKNILKIIKPKTKTRFIETNIEFEVNISNDNISILKLLELNELDNSLAKKRPDIIKDWDYKKNKGLKPTQFKVNSMKKVWWKCKEGHEWESPISRRVSLKSCPYCSNAKILIGYNDLTTTHPKLVKQWNYEKNGDLKPTEFVSGSNKKVWWKCEHGHEWDAIIVSRTGKEDYNCPVCLNKKTLKGYNDLATTNPKLAREWHPTKNGNLRPTDIVQGCGKTLWWQCNDCGSEWEATLDIRSRGYKNCPCCKSKKKQLIVNANY